MSKRYLVPLIYIIFLMLFKFYKKSEQDTKQTDIYKKGLNKINSTKEVNFYSDIETTRSKHSFKYKSPEDINKGIIFVLLFMYFIISA